MLTSSSQYLHPDYLQPLPTTLDAKKSPLALLAQTCSSIGKDTTPSKSIIPPLEKEKKDTDKSSEKSNSTESSKRPTSRDAKDGGRDSANKPGFRTVPPKEIPPLVPISSSEKSSSPPSVPEATKSMDNTTVTSVISRPVSATTSVTGSNNSSSRTRDDHRETSSAKSCHPHQTHSPLGHLPSKPTSHPQLSSLSGLPYSSLSLMGHGLPPVDTAMTNPSHTSPLAVHAGLGFSSVPAAAAAAAAAAQNSVLKASAASGLSPYVAYARVRTPSGATTLVPVCRDPYCTHCQLTLQNSHLSSTCTSPGCAQCAHEKSLQSLGSSLGLPGSSLSLYPSLAQVSSSSGFPSLPFSSSLYHPSMLTQQGLPLVCNWVAGNDYCGKRFTNSEELLQHLRSHTSCMDSVSLASYSALGFPPSVAAASLAACHGHLGNPAALSPNSLRRTYPTSLSPVSSILNANRYHPYKSPLGSVPQVLTPTQQLTTAQYYPPYSLYGQRLGAAAVP